MIKSILSSIILDSKYSLDIFPAKNVDELEQKIILKNNKGKNKPFINCIIREKLIQLKPEEIVRQLYAQVLINDYDYSKKRIFFEYPVNFGREKKQADGEMGSAVPQAQVLQQKGFQCAQHVGLQKNVF